MCLARSSIASLEKRYCVFRKSVVQALRQLRPHSARTDRSLLPRTN
ncbi:hypothetical protein ACFPRL_04835 [Pseudoclavibacter helvolus]